MNDRIFTVDYYPAAQRKFERALKDEEFDKAYGILEDMLPAHTPDEQIKRTVVLAQGYKALTNKLIVDDIDTLREQTKNLEHSLQKTERELEKYKEIGSLEEIGEHLEKLNVYEDIGGPEELSAIKERFADISKTLDSLVRI